MSPNRRSAAPVSPRASLRAAMLFAGFAVIGASGAYAEGGGKTVAQAKLQDAQGRDAGTVTLSQGKDMLHGSVSVTGISPGSHGLHIHTTGKCDAPGFTTAGGHLNPDGKQHGLQNPMGAHQGDLPDIVVGPDGSGKATFMPHTTLATLFDADGSAFVVHAGPDDNKTDPSGNSGGRLLCGVLQKIGK